MTGCMVNLNANISGSEVRVCGRNPAYSVWIRDCTICWLLDFPECMGHPVCVEHTAEMRADDELRDRGKLTELTRIRSL